MSIKGIPIVVDGLRTVSKCLERRLEALKIRGENRDHPNYNIVEVGQNTEKILGDPRRLAVTQTPLKNYQLTLVGKTHNLTSRPESEK